MPRRRPFVCCAPKCDSREARFKEDQDFHLYKFPTDKSLLRKWVAVLGRGDNFIPTERSRLCSKHFQSGKRNYKPASVDFIPSIFWYNVPKVSEYCSGCRRKVCKCETKPEEATPVDIDARLLELYAEEEFEDEDDDGDEHEDEEEIPEYAENEDGEFVLQVRSASDMDSSNVEVSSAAFLENQNFMSGDTDVTVAIASFLQQQEEEEYAESIEQCTTEGHEPTDDVLMVEPGAEAELVEEDVQGPIVEEPVRVPTAFDETIERVIRWEDCTDISISPVSTQSENIESSEQTVEPESSVVEAGKLQDTSLAQPESTPMEEDVDDSKEELKAIVQEIVPEPDPFYNSDPELEREWRKRERKLIRAHKAEEKKILMQMVQNNQNKNQVIDDLKKEVKELKKTNKTLQHSMDLLEIRLREEFDAKYKLDVKKLLDEANLNLALLQNCWTQEKKLILQANTALARLLKSGPAALESSAGKMEVAAVTQFIASTAAVPEQLAETETANPSETDEDQTTTAPSRGKQFLRIESCEDSSETIKYFTGMPSKEDFDSFFEFLEEKAKNMKYWNGKSWASSTEAKRQRAHRVDLKNQLFLTLSRLKRGFTTKELGFFFGVDPVYISCIFITFCKLIESELCNLYQTDYQAASEFAGLPEIVQTHYPKLYATLRITEIRLETRPCLNLNTKSAVRKLPPTFKVLILFSPNGHIFFISPVFPGRTTDRAVILESKVFDLIPSDSEVFVDKVFDVSEECISRQLQLHVFPHDASHTLTDDDPWEIKLMTKCKSRMEKLIGLMRYFRIFDNDLHLAGANHTPMTVRVALLMQYYFDTKCFNFQR